MDKFIPYEKLSKKKKRELNAKRRQTWRINPVTRKPENPKAYNRKKAQRKDYDDYPNALSFFIEPSPGPPFFHKGRKRTPPGKGANPEEFSFLFCHCIYYHRSTVSFYVFSCPASFGIIQQSSARRCSLCR